MQVDADVLREPRTVVAYQSQQEALKVLGRVLHDERGVVLLHGRKAAGKSVVIDQFARKSRHNVAVAVVDGARTKTGELLSAILEQFGYKVSLGTTDELLNMVNVFSVQQTRARQAPVLVVKNIHDMFPSALGALCRLAAMRVNRTFAMRLILVSDRDVSRIIQSPSMSAVAARVISTFELGAMTPAEAVRYVYAKLRSIGIDPPDDVFSVEVCEKIHAISGGWPGEMDELIVSTLQQVSQFPVRLDDVFNPNAPECDETPKLILTRAGEPPQEIRLSEKRALIGRSGLSDIIVTDRFVSNQHALLIRNGNAVVLVDLKSRNGTYVNARRIESKVLLHNDIIAIGDHRLKVVYASGDTIPVLENVAMGDMSDTTNMKNIADARRAREERLPTIRTAVTRNDA